MKSEGVAFMANSSRGSHSLGLTAAGVNSPRWEMARSERFELPTLGIEIRCSIQLSYERLPPKRRGCIRDNARQSDCVCAVPENSRHGGGQPGRFRPGPFDAVPALGLGLIKRAVGIRQHRGERVAGV